MGKSVVIVGPDKHLGELIAGGLGWTDTGNKTIIGGLSRRVLPARLALSETRGLEVPKANEYSKGPRTKTAIDDSTRTAWNFEPHVAEKIFEDFVREHVTFVHRDEWLDRAKGVTKKGRSHHVDQNAEWKDLRRERCSSMLPTRVTFMAASCLYHVDARPTASTAKSGTARRWAFSTIATISVPTRQPEAKRKTRLKISPYVVPGDPVQGSFRA